MHLKKKTISRTLMISVFCSQRVFQICKCNQFTRLVFSRVRLCMVYKACYNSLGCLTSCHTSLIFILFPLYLQTFGSAIPSTSNHYGTTHFPGLAFLGNSCLFAGVCGFSASHHAPSVSSAVYCKGTFALIT